MHKQIIVWLSFLMLVAGCSWQKKQQKQKSMPQYQEIIAKYADLPDAPFQAQLEHVVQSEQSHDQIQIFYICSMPKADIVTFYEQQMERLGWQLQGQSDIDHCLLLYRKPLQFCSVLIADRSIAMYIGNIKGA